MLYRHGCPCGRDCPSWNGEWHAPCSQFYITSPCYEERQWTDNRQGKSRRIVLIRNAWHLSEDSELAYQISSIWHGQRSVAYAAARNSRLIHPRQTGLESAQETLNLLD